MMSFIKRVFIYLSVMQLINASLIKCLNNTDNLNCTLACEKGETYLYSEIPLYLIGILACFWALAIICDTYFVPALEIMADKCNFSDDIAGATFMAAGGSAPELFTSFVGTFLKSTVGFNTIVGSAVFNVLFVIAMCVLFQKKKMKLTAWPLIRDCSFYTCSLIVLAFFFKVFTPNKIIWWEALVLLIMYVVYIYIMKNNDKLEDYFVNKGWLKKRVIDPIPLTFRARIIERLLHGATLSDSVKALVVAKIVGDIEKTFNEIDTNNDGVLQLNEFKEMIEKLHQKNIDNDAINTLFKEIDENNDNVISKEEFEKWYISSDIRLETVLKMFYDETPQDTLKESIREDSFDTLVEEGELTFESYMEWAKNTIMWTDLKSKAGEEAIILDGVNNQMRIPLNKCGLIIWIITIIPMTLFSYSIPDVSNPKNKGLYLVAFLNSILWIGFVSYWMVDWAELSGNTIGIPINVMGLTILAMGTSVPDLISSVIVARQGKGDMAISSSIGSNIFDILIGLPLPWLSYSIYSGSPVYIESDNLALSLIILILMLIVVVLSIRYCNWETKKELGFMMMLFYVLFVMQDLFRSNWNC